MFPCYSVTLWLRSTLTSVLAHCSSIVSLSATCRIAYWGRVVVVSLIGSGRNFITSLMAELTPRSFGPRLEGRFAKQMSGVNKRQEDKETCLIILLLESACLLTCAGCTVDKGALFSQ